MKTAVKYTLSFVKRDANRAKPLIEKEPPKHGRTFTAKIFPQNILKIDEAMI